MRWPTALALAAVMTAAFLWPTGAAEPGSASREAATLSAGPQPTMPANVRRILEEKCTQCHGADVEAAPMGFNYVLDLPRLIKSGKLVPEKPESGLLLQMVDSKQMPAAGAKNGPLSPQQINAIRQWALGMGSQPAGAPGESAQTAPAPAENEQAQATFADRLLTLLGHYHILLVHLPIGLIIGAGLAEIAGFFRRRKFLESASAWCIILGGAFAIMAAITGDILSETLVWTGRRLVLMQTHMALGIITAVLAGVGAVLVWPSRRWRHPAWMTAYRIAVLAALASVSLTGHFGGLLVYGESWLAW